MKSNKPLIYLITEGATTVENFSVNKRRILETIRRAVEVKISLVQIREKLLTAKLIFEITREAVKITRNSDTKLLVNDRADIAFAANADGVHLTENSLSAEIIRRSFGENFVIGVSAHTIETAEVAKNQKADFVTFSPVFYSPNKGKPQGLEKLREVCEKLKPFPVLALGGIDETNYQKVLENGASGFAAIRFFWSAEPILVRKCSQIKFTRGRAVRAPTMTKDQKVCLTIAGLDPSGGAGIIADIKTFSAFGCFATAAVASLTFQNTTGVFGAEHQTAEIVRAQVEPILEDFKLSSVKTGMLPTREIIEETARLIKENDLKNFVVDPVVRSTSGFDLIDDAALKSLIEKLFPLSDIITPNLPEAERIAEMKIETEADIEKAGRIMQAKGARNVLIKGGHGLKDEGGRMKDEIKKKKIRDFLFVGDKLEVFEAEYIETSSTHGTGCVLASAICANLALGKSLVEAVEIGKKFVWNGIKTAKNLGRGNSPVNVETDFRFQISDKEFS